MGIDIYMEWRGQTKAEKEAQYTGFCATAGQVGYLREAYHGGPYATMVLISEDWDAQPRNGFRISAAELRRRLPATVMTAIYREHVVYGERNPGVGGPQDLHAALSKLLTEVKSSRADRDSDYDTPTDEQVRQVEALIAARRLSPVALAFVDFVLLAERKEKEVGEPVAIIVSALT